MWAFPLFRRFQIGIFGGLSTLQVRLRSNLRLRRLYYRWGDVCGQHAGTVCGGLRAHQSQEEGPLSPVPRASPHKYHRLCICNGEHHILRFKDKALSSALCTKWAERHRDKQASSDRAPPFLLKTLGKTRSIHALRSTCGTCISCRAGRTRIAS